MTARRDQELLRRLARHHWVRIHGTPSVTVLVGGAAAKEDHGGGGAIPADVSREPALTEA